MKVLIATLLLFSQLGFSATLNPIERERYTQSLNTMASTVMQWYGSLLQNNASPKWVQSDHWRQFRHQYPHHIETIQITNTELKNDEVLGKQFIVSIQLSFKKDNTIQTQQKVDIFIFKQGLLRAIKSKKNGSEFFTPKLKYNSDYFQYREVAYSWLAYLDGAKLPETLNNNVNNVLYEVNIGANKWQGTAEKIKIIRKKSLFTGGHILRSVNIKPFKSINNKRVIELIVQWKGVDENGTSVLAKIKQTLTYQVGLNKQWYLLNVIEKHLLPDDAPWIGFLC